MQALRTPDERFANLPDFAYSPHYVDDLAGFAQLRAAYIDEGPKSAPHTFLCLHGEPTWSFLYRKMIPVFAASGARVVAPDLFGFGRSDKLLHDTDYTFHLHRRSLIALIERLDLQHITLVVQDWGGLLGLTLPIEADLRARFERVIVMNTGLAVGVSAGPGFDAWRSYVASTPDIAVGKLMKRSCKHLAEAEVAAYDAPYPSAEYKAGVRQFPQLVMTSPEMEGVAESKAAAKFWSTEWTGKSFMAHGAADPVFGTAQMEALRSIIRGCPPMLVLPEAGHFAQEWGARIAEAALRSFA